MSDAPPTHTDSETDDEPARDDPATDAADPEPDRESQAEAEEVEDGRDVREFLLKGALVILTLFAVFAAFRFYAATSNVIDVWVADQYRSLFQAAFNLAVLLVAGIGISLVVRELA